MFSSESDEMTALWPNDSLTLTFYETFLNSLPNWTTFVKEFFYLVLSLESDQMTALWPNDSWTFTFYEIFSNSIQNWITFVKSHNYSKNVVVWFDGKKVQEDFVRIIIQPLYPFL